MLGRKKRFIEDCSLFVDMLVSLFLLAFTFSFLRAYSPLFSAFLTDLLGREVEIAGTRHMSDDIWIFIVILFNLFAALRATGFYQLDLFVTFKRLVFETGKGIFVGVGFTILFLYLFDIPNVSRSLLLGFGGLFGVYLVGKEILLRQYLRRIYYVQKPLEALFACPADLLEEKLHDFSQQRLQSVVVKGVVLTDGEPEDLPSHLRALVKGRYKNIPQLLAQGRYDIVFVGVSGKGRVEISQEVLAAAEEQGVEVWHFADFLSPHVAKPEFDDYAGTPIIVFKTTPHMEGQMLVKRVFDVVVSLSAITALLPVFLAVCLAVKLTSKGPMLFKQERTGWRGRVFKMFKFRTMYVDAEKRRAELMAQNEMSGPVFKLTKDPRITKVGGFLRRFSLDELPQLFNVLRGEMSLVGPRPLPVYETEAFEAFKDRRRLSVLPGVTGLWQVSGRSGIEDFEEWVRLDLEYIDRWSLWLDMLILLRTIPAVFTASGAK